MKSTPAFTFDAAIPKHVKATVRVIFDARYVPSWVRRVEIKTFADSANETDNGSVLSKPEYESLCIWLNDRLFTDAAQLDKTLNHEIDHLMQAHTMRLAGRLTSALEGSKERLLWEALSYAIEMDRCEIERFRKAVKA